MVIKIHSRLKFSTKKNVLLHLVDNHFLFFHFHDCLKKKKKLSTECLSKVETLAKLAGIKITSDSSISHLAFKIHKVGEFFT
jgi:hypothetical protein